jgi:hypothetical protein
VVSVAVLVPLCAAAGLWLGAPGRDAGPAVPALPAATAPGPDVQVWAAGRPYGIGGGAELTLTAQGITVTGRASWSTPADQVPPGEITTTVLGDGTSALAVGLYRGPGAAARVTVDLDGRSVEARVATLAGEPGWCAFFTDAAGTGTAPTVTVYAADGSVLARQTKQT